MSGLTDILLAPDVRPSAQRSCWRSAASNPCRRPWSDFRSARSSARNNLEADGDSGLGGLFLWINAGRLPLLVLIILALGVFAIAGFFLQGLAHGVGLSIPASIAAIAAAGFSLPVIRLTSRGIARIIPRDETYAVDEADFIGHVAEVSIGPLDQGLPGRVRLKDVFGNWHSLVARAGPELHAASGRRQCVAGRP